MACLLANSHCKPAPAILHYKATGQHFAMQVFKRAKPRFRRLGRIRKIRRMNKPAPHSTRSSQIGLLSAVAVVMQWLSQPPLALWPLAFVAIIPWLMIALDRTSLSKRSYLMIWLAGFLYWLLTLQGLRHANPAIYFAWILLAGYLAVYGPLFIVTCKKLMAWRVPMWIAAPSAWVGLECIRNYFATGISAAMLGHTLADVPALIQIADVFGSYGVSFLLIAVNFALLRAHSIFKKTQTPKQQVTPLVFAVLLVTITLAYGQYRLAESPSEKLSRFALIQRSEVVEYVQDEGRAAEIFRNYVNETVSTLSESTEPIDAVVWPESMYSGGRVWMIADADAKSPEGAQITSAELQQGVRDNRRYFLQRSSDLQRLLAASQPSSQDPQATTQEAPHLIGGCGVIHYRDVPQAYSGILHMSPQGDVVDWYGKTHLVMCGEYIPIIPWIPGLRSLIPPGMGLTVGSGAKNFRINDTTVAPNICIETAVERVTVNQMNALLAERSDARCDRDGDK